MVTYKIIVKGLVQGIGYRPFVAESAERCSVGGWVRNTDGIVTILASGKAENVGRFLEKLKSESPKAARVEKLVCEELPYQPFSGFSIAESERGDSQGIPWVPADLATCGDCLRELHEADNRRYRHPFISCTACGPRYSIIEALPYDREHISMKKFPMCAECASEYKKQGDVRRHAQTIACPDCGPVLRFTRIGSGWGEAGSESEEALAEVEPAGAGNPEGVHVESGSVSEEALAAAVRCLRAGGIVAVKDIGGYHLACTPFSEETVRQLRLLKGRERKPFAVMFPDLSTVKEYCQVNPAEEMLISSAIKPITLLKRAEGGKRLAGNVCGNSPDIGAMLPCNPLQTLLVEELGPLIMTSANASGDLLILRNEKMIGWMEGRVRELAGNLPACAVLSHDRPIVTPLDDSIVRVVLGRTQIFRRTRGFVPEPVSIDTEKRIFAAGGDLKACFCHTGDGKAYLSQYLGDLAEEGCYSAYLKEVGRMRALFGFEPEYIACDMHPGYLSAQRCGVKRESAESGMPEDRSLHKVPKPGEKCLHNVQEQEIGSFYKVQHHEAHVASVIAEHHLRGNVLGFAFDGTGYGRDGSIWGSEVFLWNGAFMRRVAHLKSVRLIGGDEGAKNADTILYGYMASFAESTRERMWAALRLAQRQEEQSGGEEAESGREEQRGGIEEAESSREEQSGGLDEQRFALVEKALTRGVNAIKSSSMGRLFDAVSAFLDICHYNSYEGEAAIEVENLAATAERSCALSIALVPVERISGDGGGGTEYLGDTEPLFLGTQYPEDTEPLFLGTEYLGDTEPLFLGMAEALEQGVPRAEIARGFLDAVSDFICAVCDCIAEETATCRVELRKKRDGIAEEAGRCRVEKREKRDSVTEETGRRRVEKRDGIAEEAGRCRVELRQSIEKDAESRAVRQIALSGGTFQNRILLEWTICRLEESGYVVYINEQVPPGDGGLCLGQAYLCAVQSEWKEAAVACDREAEGGCVEIGGM